MMKLKALALGSLVTLSSIFGTAGAAEASIIYNYNTRNITRYNDGTASVVLVGPRGTYEAKCDFNYHYPIDDKGVNDWESKKMSSNFTLTNYMGFITNKVRLKGCGNFYKH